MQFEDNALYDPRTLGQAPVSDDEDELPAAPVGEAPPPLPSRPSLGGGSAEPSVPGRPSLSPSAASGISSDRYNHGSISRIVAEQRLVRRLVGRWFRALLFLFLFFPPSRLPLSSQPSPPPGSSVPQPQTNKPHGAFLLRQSGAVDGYVVSLSVPGQKFAHVKVTRSDGGLKTVRVPAASGVRFDHCRLNLNTAPPPHPSPQTDCFFPDLDSLVKFYRQHSIHSGVPLSGGILPV